MLRHYADAYAMLERCCCCLSLARRHGAMPLYMHDMPYAVALMPLLCHCCYALLRRSMRDAHMASHYQAHTTSPHHHTGVDAIFFSLIFFSLADYFRFLC